LAEVSEDSYAEVSDVRDLGDRVLGLGRLWFRSAGGVELEQEAAFLHSWRDGRLVEARSWISHSDALDAVGLRG
jgi:hypothetical protein